MNIVTLIGIYLLGVILISIIAAFLDKSKTLEDNIYLVIVWPVVLPFLLLFGTLVLPASTLIYFLLLFIDKIYEKFYNYFHGDTK